MKPLTRSASLSVLSGSSKSAELEDKAKKPTLQKMASARENAEATFQIIFPDGPTRKITALVRKTGDKSEALEWAGELVSHQHTFIRCGGYEAQGSRHSIAASYYALVAKVNEIYYDDSEDGFGKEFEKFDSAALSAMANENIERYLVALEGLYKFISKAGKAREAVVGGFDGNLQQKNEVFDGVGGRENLDDIDNLLRELEGPEFNKSNSQSTGAAGANDQGVVLEEPKKSSSQSPQNLNAILDDSNAQVDGTSPLLPAIPAPKKIEDDGFNVTSETLEVDEPFDEKGPSFIPFTGISAGPIGSIGLLYENKMPSHGTVAQKNSRTAASPALPASPQEVGAIFNEKGRELNTKATTDKEIVDKSDKKIASMRDEIRLLKASKVHAKGKDSIEAGGDQDEGVRGSVARRMAKNMGATGPLNKVETGGSLEAKSKNHKKLVAKSNKNIPAVQMNSNEFKGLTVCREVMRSSEVSTLLPGNKKKGKAQAASMPENKSLGGALKSGFEEYGTGTNQGVASRKTYEFIMGDGRGAVSLEVTKKEKVEKKNANKSANSPIGFLSNLIKKRRHDHNGSENSSTIAGAKRSEREKISADRLKLSREVLCEKWNTENSWLPLAERTMYELASDAQEYADIFQEEIDRDKPNVTVLTNITMLFQFVFEDLIRKSKGDEQANHRAIAKAIAVWWEGFKSARLEDPVADQTDPSAISGNFQRYAKDIARNVSRSSVQTS